ncbi:MAG: hypothetical protein J6U54_21035 [Clostridiales bacterium]|nr:hypothetical protein [Clostridiales bacterium]
MKQIDDDRFDAMMREAIGPSVSPSEELNNKIVYEAAKMKIGEGNTAKRSHARLGIVPIVLIVLLVASVGVSAGVIVGKKIYSNGFVITEHAVSSGNESYVIDEAIANTDIEETADPKYTTEDESFDSYEELLDKADYGIRFTEEYPLLHTANYSVTKGPDIVFFDSNASFRYARGKFEVFISVAEGNIADDAAFSIAMHSTSNTREYQASTGQNYTLVDDTFEDKVKTYVIIEFGNMDGYLTFTDLTDDDIHHVLDTVIVPEG